MRRLAVSGLIEVCLSRNTPTILSPPYEQSASGLGCLVPRGTRHAAIGSEKPGASGTRNREAKRQKTGIPSSRVLHRLRTSGEG
jgi:hypothetical protein